MEDIDCVMAASARAEGRQFDHVHRQRRLGLRGGGQRRVVANAQVALEPDQSLHHAVLVRGVENSAVQYASYRYRPPKQGCDSAPRALRSLGPAPGCRRAVCARLDGHHLEPELGRGGTLPRIGRDEHGRAGNQRGADVQRVRRAQRMGFERDDGTLHDLW